MDILPLHNLLLIAGNGRETGKTTLACQFIRNFRDLHQIVAIKISPHMHVPVSPGLPVVNMPGLYIEEETRTDTGKDSSRMLEAGARRSFFVAGEDSMMKNAIETILSETDEGSFFVCESGGLRKVVEPGVFIVVYREGQNSVKNRLQEIKGYDHVPVIFDGKHFNFDTKEIVIQDHRWKKNKA